MAAMGAAGMAALSQVVSVGSDFEQAMANVASVTDGSAESMAALTDAARTMDGILFSMLHKRPKRCMLWVLLDSARSR